MLNPHIHLAINLKSYYAWTAYAAQLQSDIYSSPARQKNRCYCLAEPSCNAGDLTILQES